MSRASKAPVSSLRARQQGELAAAILDAAERLIGERGLDGVAMADIARGAGVAVGTLYNYYADRDGLVRALFQTRRAALVPRVRAAVAAIDLTDGYEPALRAFLGAVLAALDDHRRFMRLVFEVRPPTKQRGDRTLVDELRAGLRAVVDHGVAAGEIRAPDPELAAALLSSAIRAAVSLELDRGGAFAATADAIADHVLDGIRARPRRR